MATDVERVQRWYNEHLGYLSSLFTEVEIRSFEPADTVQGKVVIEVQNNSVCGMVTVWNKSDVDVECLPISQGRATAEMKILDDRRRSESEDIATLLNAYFKRIANCGV